MNAEQRKLTRLLRLERLRAIAKQGAASEAARAESTLVQVQALAARSHDLAQEYSRRTDAQDGADLRRLGVFAAGLQRVCRNTQADILRAQAAADFRQAELATAERRRAAVADRAAAASREIGAGSVAPILNARRRSE